MALRKSTIFICLTVLQLLLLFALAGHARYRTEADLPAVRAMAGMVQQLGLTDLCLVTEASYTRHPSLADSGTPFQDSPASLEHFPSGALITPPEHLFPKTRHVAAD